jgi:hypothetical protein
MIVAVKCNIASLALENSAKLLYGFSCKDNSIAFIENYIESLACPDIILEECGSVVCENPVVVFNCVFNVNRIAMQVVEGNTVVLTATIGNGDYAGGTPPFTYQWNFDENDFEVTGPINQSQIALTPKDGKEIEDLISKITVTVTDSNGCQSVKSCWVEQGVGKCNDNYVGCTNPSDLVVTDAETYCAAPSNLIIS